MAVTDVNGLYGAPVFHHRAVAAGVRPIVGAELDDGERTAIALVIDRGGYENLCRILTRIHCQPAASLTDAVPPFAPGLHLATEDAELAAAWLAAGVPPEYLWLEVDPATQTRSLVRTLAEASQRLGLGLLATGPAMMAATSDEPGARLLAAIRLGKTLDRLTASDIPHAKAVLRSTEQLAAELGDFPQAVANNRRVADECRYELLPQEAVFPRFPCPSGRTPERHLRRLCVAGARWRYGWASAVVRRRLRRELRLIEQKGFSEYFLVVRDIVQYARSRRAPIAGRGSGASSLVAYVLGITNVCPLALDIPFERFLNERREDFPDLDIDFCWRIRDDVIDYAFERWGGDHVAMVCTHNTFQVRSAFRETAKAMGVSDAQISQLTRGRGDGRRVERIAQRSESIVGLPHLLSVHPGGIVIGRRPIDHYAPIQIAAKGVRITQYDKDGVEDVGLVKLDLLGNRALSTIREACRWLEQGETHVGCRGLRGEAEQPRPSLDVVASLCSANHGTPISEVPCTSISQKDETSPTHLDIESLPADDRATYDLMCRGDTVGCNQLESPAMRHLLQCIRPREMRDVMKALALIRPGAASIGMKDTFIRRHRGDEPTPTGYGPVDEILAPTHGVMTYEDDVMLVAAAMTGATLAEADRFRKAVQKCHDDAQRERLSRDFLDRCRDHGVDLRYAAGLWVQMAKFNAYSFCRAHAASYARLAYAVAYLRAHHPAAFWVAALNNNQSMYRPRVYVRQARRGGVRFELPDVNRSGAEFTLTGGVVRAGLNRIEGLGPTTIQSILAARRGGPYGGVIDFLDRAGVGPQETRALILCGAFDSLGASRPGMMMELKLRRTRPVRRGDRAQVPLLAAGFATSGQLADFPDDRKREDESRLLGMNLSAHPMAAWRSRLADSGDTTSGQLRRRIGRRVRIAGLLEAARLTRSQAGRELQFLTFDDEWGLFEATAFADTCRHVGRPVEGRPAIVAGTVEDHYGVVTLIADEVVWNAASQAGEHAYNGTNAASDRVV